MAKIGNWTILGDNPVAAGIRDAARFVEASSPITLATQAGDIPTDAFAIGPAILSSAVERVAPYYSAFEAIEEIKRTIDAGDAGRVYGCFTSFRVQRGSSTDDVTFRALLPALAVTLDLLSQPVTRVHARKASLLASDDGWFVTVRLADETIATVEALAVLDPAAGLDRDLLVEVTASDRVLRAEPMHQSIVVEPLANTGVRHSWWEDLNERFLILVNQRSSMPAGNYGTRLRSIWSAVQESTESGQPVSIA